MKILMILSKPFMVDPRVYKEAITLTNSEHEVTVIVWDRHSDYESESLVDGIKIVRIRNKGLMKILPHDLFRNPLWWRKAYKKGLELYKTDFKFDVVHCHDLDTLKSGVWLKKKLGIKLIYDAHEIFGYMIATDQAKFVVNATFRMERKLLRYVDHIITVTEPCKDYFKSITNTTITVINNCKDLVSTKYQPPKNDIFTISYIGIANKKRMFPQLVDIIGNIEGVRFVIACKKEALYEEVEKRSEKYPNVEFLGSIPYYDVIPKTLEANVVINMPNPKNFYLKFGLANKQFDAMVCGRAIICTKGTYSGDLTNKLSCGLVVEYNEKVKDAIIKLRNNPKLCEELGKNGLKAAIHKYNWKKQSIKLLKVYESFQHSRKVDCKKST